MRRRIQSRTPPPATRFLRLACLAAGAVNGLAWAQSGGLVIQPSFNLSQSFTDNRDLTAGDKKWDAVTQLSPGLRMTSRTGPVQGSLDYALNAQVHANSADGYASRSVSNALAAAFTAEAIERHALVDVRASITQQNLSAFGVQSAAPNFSQPNRTEVRTLSVSPVLRGSLGTIAEVEGQANWTRTAGVANGAADSNASSRSLRVYGQLGGFGWSTSVNDATSEFDGGRETKNRQANLSLSYRVNLDLTLSLQGGRETDTVQALDSATTDNWGGGFTWTPTERTVVNGQVSRRYFGTGHYFNLSHRFVRSIWRFASSRDANFFGRERGIEYANEYDSYFAQLATIIPDPVQRDAVVRALLAQQGGFLARGVTLQNRRDLSVVLQGVRTTLSIGAFTYTTRRLTDLGGTATDDFTQAGRLHQRGLTINVNYVLSPIASAALGYSGSSTAGDGSLRGSKLRTLTASYNAQLVPRIGLTLSLRRTVSDSPTLPYTENSGLATLGFAF